MRSESDQSLPIEYAKLSKKCRRLLAFACQKGRVKRKGDGFHFQHLQDLGLIDSQGCPTSVGRTVVKGNAVTSKVLNG